MTDEPEPVDLIEPTARKAAAAWDNLSDDKRAEAPTGSLLFPAQLSLAISAKRQADALEDIVALLKPLIITADMLPPDLEGMRPGPLTIMPASPIERIAKALETLAEPCSECGKARAACSCAPF